MTIALLTSVAHVRRIAQEASVSEYWRLSELIEGKDGRDEIVVPVSRALVTALRGVGL